LQRIGSHARDETLGQGRDRLVELEVVLVLLELDDRDHLVLDLLPAHKTARIE
jgi:hypothetical protein